MVSFAFRHIHLREDSFASKQSNMQGSKRFFEQGSRNFISGPSQERSLYGWKMIKCQQKTESRNLSLLLRNVQISVKICMWLWVSKVNYDEQGVAQYHPGGKKYIVIPEFNPLHTVHICFLVNSQYYHWSYWDRKSGYYESAQKVNMVGWWKYPFRSTVVENSDWYSPQLNWIVFTLACTASYYN